MNLMKSSTYAVDEPNPYKRVERIGRLCYRSEDKITEDSYKAFVKQLIDRKHFAMLEHGRITFLLYGSAVDNFMFPDDPIKSNISDIPFANFAYSSETEMSYLSLSLSHLYNPRYQHIPLVHTARYIVECAYSFGSCEEPSEGIIDGVELVCDTDIPEDVKRELTYKSVGFVCDRGVSHELVRHRVSVAQESTRYCNYAKDKFGGGNISFIYPASWDEWTNDQKNEFELILKACETTYNRMITLHEFAPQVARAVLPNALKTEVILTMNLAQWSHFFDMRYFGTTGKPHPDMEIVASDAYHRHFLHMLE